MAFFKLINSFNIYHNLLLIHTFSGYFVWLWSICSTYNLHTNSLESLNLWYTYSIKIIAIVIIVLSQNEFPPIKAKSDQLTDE